MKKLSHRIRIARTAAMALAVTAAVCTVGPTQAQDAPTQGAAASAQALPIPGATYLGDFGEYKHSAQAQAAFDKAVEQLHAQGGGMLMIPADAPEGWKPQNTSQMTWRKPAPPAPTKQWGYGEAITIVDLREGKLNIQVPQMSGIELSRNLTMAEGDSAPHWDYLPMLKLTNVAKHGSTSYRDWLLEDVKAGEDRRFYVRTTRGVFPGMFLNTGDYGKVVRLAVQSIGFDDEKQLPYLVADTDMDVHAGAILHNKTHTNAIKIDTFSHTENQTFDFMNWRREYSQGDTYLFDARFDYNSDVHSTAGDENGVVYAAMIHSKPDVFSGKVESWDPQTHELVYDRPATNTHTIGTGRPIINMNPEKQIAKGHVIIVRPASYWDLSVKGDPVFEGKTYPSTLADRPFGGEKQITGKELRMGGLIRLSKDAPVTSDHVGWYFAVDEDDEKVPAKRGRAGDLRRWYMIDSVTENEDGTKTLTIIRHWWGARPAQSPTLYNPDNYSRDGHVKELSYVIAPGANVYDLREGVMANARNGALKRKLKLTPSASFGSKHDFAPGDPIEQAVGPDPFKPIPHRIWAWDNVPGAFPSPMFDIANRGFTSRYAVFQIHGGRESLEENRERMADKRQPYENIMIVETASENGITFRGDVEHHAFWFQQRNGNPHTIAWNHANQEDQTVLGVDGETGTFTVTGGAIKASQGIVGTPGISGSDTAANNLRGINVQVGADQKELTVTFATPEADADYAVFITPSWLTNHAVTEQTPEGFTIAFDKAPGAAKTLHWMLVR